MLQLFDYVVENYGQSRLGNLPGRTCAEGT